MAGVAYVKVRLWNPGRSNIYGDSSNVLNYLERAIFHDGKSVKQKAFEILWISTTTAAEELGNAADSVKDGTTVPYQLTLVSTDNTKDIVTGVGARRVAVIGISVSSIKAYQAGEVGKLTVEVMNLNGTTDVLSTRFYLWCPHAYVCEAGSEGDTVGTVTIESPANTTLLTIAAANMDSNGCRLFFGDGDYVKLDRVIIQPTAALAAGDGVALSVTEDAFEFRYSILDDFKIDYYTVIHYNGSVDISNAWPLAKRSTKYSSLLFKQALIANAQVCKIHCTINIHK